MHTKLHPWAISVCGHRNPGEHCEGELHGGQRDAIDPQALIEEAVDFLNEALARLDIVMEHQAAALIDHAINILAGWTCEAPADRDTSAQRH